MKKETLAERLNQAMEQSGMSQGALAKASGVAQPTIWRLTSGNARGSTKIVEIANALGVRTEWLSTGIGPMRADGQQPTFIAPVKTDPNIFRVDVLDLTFSAGPGSFMISEFVEVLHAIEFTTEHARSLFGNRSQDDVKVMTVDGDSMNPTIRSGDRLFFDISVRNFKVDGVYAFVFGQHFHVKRLQMQGLQLAVLSDNPAYKDWYVTEETQDQLYIMGKALIHESIAYNKL
ncbi:TPA: helix-turn-helix transcriptional regulator [Kluyvera ascorbata]|nr:helix-turn-helix transcriptional regulator [Kluyvera georgiana]HAT7515127.1 helix-turn-helix transcriptional regulator [Kluyvera ascorbata]HDG1693144.1 helix-turn-helix transcriptional regulator [Kluyvera georgiana]HDG1706391.1 helix-turn-helix transcriptional regulator [Kluyvera ascorbata]